MDVHAIDQPQRQELRKFYKVKVKSVPLGSINNYISVKDIQTQLLRNAQYSYPKNP